MWRCVVSLCVATAVALLAPAGAAAGRYQVQTFDSVGLGPERALVIDSDTGHLWLWLERPASACHDGERLLVYQGQVRPGRDVGEVVARQSWRWDGLPPEENADCERER